MSQQRPNAVAARRVRNYVSGEGTAISGDDGQDVVDPATTTESELGLLMAGQHPGEAGDAGSDPDAADPTDRDDPVDAPTGGERA